MPRSARRECAMMGGVTDGPTHCCSALTTQVTFRCDMHPIKGECGDYLIAYAPHFDEYGIWVHDGPGGSASSWVTIDFCPFCGSKLPASRRDDWFDHLEAMGIEPSDASAELRAYGWWLKQ